MLNNPELKRNFWLELSTHRLIAAPILLALIYTLIFQNMPIKPDSTAFYFSKAVFVIGTIIWGSYLANNSMLKEVNQRTWDNQRISALPPLQLMLGKLFGATVFTWYVGLPCLAMMLYLPEMNPNISNLSQVLLLLLSALLAHAVSLSLGILQVKSEMDTSKPYTGFGLVLLLAYLTSSFIVPKALKSDQPTLDWYQNTFPTVDFLILTLLCFAAWALLSAYRNMQSALQIKVRPWAMIGFVLFLSTFLTGFAFIGGLAVDWLAVSRAAIYLCFALSIGFAYLTVLYEKRTLVNVQRFFRSWKEGNTTQALQETPSFIALASLALISLLVIFGIELSAGEKNYLQDTVLRGSLTNNLIATGCLTTFILLLRDIGLLYYFSLGNKPQKAVVTTLVYLVLLYALLPFLLSSMGGIAYPMKFLVTYKDWGHLIAPMIALIHTAIMTTLLIKQYRETQQRLLTAR